jgi:hypothetical protein
MQEINSTRPFSLIQKLAQMIFKFGELACCEVFGMSVGFGVQGQLNSNGEDFHLLGLKVVL